MSESENEIVNDTVEDQRTSEQQNEGPGRRLREAREAQSLSRESVASELRLQTRMVAALEEDDDSSMPPPAFVIGYLRSYARRLGLPADEIVRAYEQNLEGPPQEIVSRVRKSQVSSRDLPVRMVTWLIFIGLGALLVVWWLSQQPAHEEPVTEPEVATVAPETTPSAPESLASQQQAQSSERPEPAAEGDSQSPVFTESEASASGEPTLVAPNTLDSVPETQSQAAEVEAVSQPEPEPTTTATGLRLEFEADSWTQVTNADGQQLVSRVIKAGRTLRFTDKPPFRVILGYAPGVTVHYQGERFDPTPYVRRDVARFSIGASDDQNGEN
ncbi:RodZ domain-containing protein [Thiohalomonas denitrificans]|uniref:Cytoskeleton protein RodZ n=1 Tax=Thiohalomonas denitrificans TaxID=415747 RepID=A0A1G5Q211_9GAMM|nr:RodZ domain-containing protein [Thiohalomonas denitrificans]SCZ55500.1 cytoskeleton protein RodZ [Thiohalomonas denitrificans]